MAISRAQPLLLLLAAMFFVPALCIDIDFEYCNKSGYDFGNITSVQYNPSTGMLSQSYLLISGYAKNFNIKVVDVSLKSGTSTPVLIRRYNYVHPDLLPSTGQYTLDLPGVRGSYIRTKDYKIVVTYVDNSGDSPKTVMCFEYGQVLDGQNIL